VSSTPLSNVSAEQYRIVVQRSRLKLRVSIHLTLSFLLWNSLHAQALGQRELKKASCPTCVLQGADFFADDDLLQRLAGRFMDRLLPARDDIAEVRLTVCETALFSSWTRSSSSTLLRQSNVLSCLFSNILCCDVK
jgi:hypothetical protein